MDRKGHFFTRSKDDLLDLYDELWEVEHGEADYDKIVEAADLDSVNFLDERVFDKSDIDSRSRRSEPCLISRNELRSIICEKYNQEIANSGAKEASEYRVVFSDGDTIDQIRLFSHQEELSKNVQAYIMNLAAPSSVYELEMILDLDPPMLDMESAIECTNGGWTAPRWAKAGDIIFFSHGKRAIAKITATKTELKRNKEYYTEEEYRKLDALIEKERELHAKYGGTIFAVGQLIGAPEIIPDEEMSEGWHYKTRIFAEIGGMYAFPNPVKVDDCDDFLHISMTSGITPVYGDIFDSLKNKLKEFNSIPLYLESATATPIPLSNINENNWMTLSNEFRRSFMFEAQFRHYYVDYLLKALSGRKTIFRECRCKKAGIGNSFIDNVILFENKYLPVEVKLSIFVEQNIKKQVRKYCFDDFIVLDEKKNRIIHQNVTYNNRVLIVDTYSVYIYDYEANSVTEIMPLDDLVDLRAVNQLHNCIANLLSQKILVDV